MFEVDVTYDRDDYVRAFRFMSRRQLRIFNWMIVIGTVMSASVLYRADPADFHWWVIPAILGLGIFFFGLIRVNQRWNIGRQLKSAPDAQGSHRWVINGEGIRITGALSNTEIKWEAIIKVRESKSDLFFYSATRFARFLPKRVLTDEQQKGHLRRLLTERLGNKAELT